MGHATPARPNHPRWLLAGGISLAMAAVPLLAAAPAGATTPALPKAPAGLFGASDPTYDGVFRQSLSLLAYQAAGLTPPAAAVAWLVAQQCANGGFSSYRADTSKPCAPYDAATFSGGEDTNATGLAIAALKSVGKTSAQTRATTWLLSVENKDGGWEYTPGSGSGSDANSTAIVVTGLASVGGQGVAVTRGQDFLKGLQIGCAGFATGTDGAVAYQDFGNGLVRNDKATAQAVLGLAGSGLPIPAKSLGTTSVRLTCPPGTPATAPSPADVGAGYLMREMDAFGGAIPNADFTTGNPTKGTVNIGDTAWAVLSLEAAGTGRSQVAAALTILNHAITPVAPKVAGAAATTTAATDDPGALALAALAGSAGGESASTVNALVVRIGATARGGAAAPTTTPSPTPTATTPAGNGGTLPDTGGSPLPAILGLAGALLVAAGVGLRLTGRRGRHA
ncbi:MAG TPA: hypothetical protein VIC82_04380 [Candidatus Nanopelagicales bacterium]